ncbi:MAG: diguanylate cyclase [Mogibacterium sp.]|nr:diguanylate cyclase [Mogibacterium sp.]
MKIVTLLRHAMNPLRFAGLTKQELKMCEPEVRKRNAITLGWLIPAIFVMVIALLIASFIPGSGEEPNKVLYAITAVVILILYGVYRKFFLKNPKHILLMSYAFMVASFIFGIFEATRLGEDSTGTVFCVFLVAVPFMAIERPIKIINFIISMEIILLIICKTNPNPGGDKFIVVNSIACCFIGSICTYMYQRSQYSDIKNHLLLQIQRDTDMMTGARSRVAFMHDMGVMNTDELSGGIVFCDVNGLKKANDKYGHDAGDRLIKEAFSIMYKYFKEEGDRIYRTGGDEFVIISLGNDEEAFKARFDDMTENDPRREILSCGCIWMDTIQDADTALKKAEEMMYLNKQEFYLKHPEKDRRTR